MTDPIEALALAAACAFLPVDPPRVTAVPDVPFVLTALALDLRVDYESGTISGTAALHLRNVAGRPAADVPLLLNRLMGVSAVADLRGATLRFDQDVVIFADDSVRQVTAIVVRLGREVAPGDSVAIVVRYGGRLVGYAETGSLYIRDHVDRDFTIIRSDAYAFPVLGVPSQGVNRSLPRESFTFSASVTVPAGLVVAMGGQALPASRRDSLVTWSYRSDRRAPFLNIAIAPYRTLDRDGVRIFHFPADSAGAEMVERAVRAAVARYEAWYGPLGQDWRLTVIEIPEGWGSQADLAAGIIETADAFRDRDMLYQLYHELSHLWNVGDLEQPSPRWNEGLASFLQWRMAAELDGWAGWDWLLDWLEQSLRRRCESRLPCASVPYAEYGQAALTDLSYGVGTLMFYLLYHTMTPEGFDRAYRDFFQRYRDSGAASRAMVAAFTQANPVSERIFADWFFTTRWYPEFARGRSVRDMLADYTRP